MADAPAGALVKRPGIVDFLLHFVKQVAEVPLGKVMLTVWAGYWVWLASRKRTRAPKRGAPDAAGSSGAASGDDAVAERRGKVDKEAFSRMLNMIVRRLWSRHGAYLAAYVTSLITRVFVTVKLADIGGRNAGFFGARKWSQMFTCQAIFGVWCMVGAVCSGAMKLLEKRVALSVREILYEELTERYFDERTLPYYRVGTADPPARLTADLDMYAREITHLLGYFLKPAIDTCHLTFVLGRRLGGRSIMFFLFYFWFSSKSLARVKKSMPVGMKEAAVLTQAHEGELRARHQKIHAYKEQIAMQGGTAAERSSVRAIFGRLVAHVQSTMTMYFPLDVVTTYVLKYGGAMVGFTVLIPREYLNVDSPRSTAEITAGFVGNSALLQALANAMKDLADSVTELPRVAGLAARVYRLVHDMEHLPPRKSSAEGGVLTTAGDRACVKIDGLTVTAPSKADEELVLIRNLSLEVKKGENTVVRGPNGVGKSSLFRVLSGLWDPLAADKLEVPVGTFFMPQDCYFPVGTLLDQVTYPRRPLEGDRAPALALLERVGLGSVVDTHGLDVAKDWHSILSGGQKQRLAWCRMLHASPRFSFVDEGTSAISRDVIDALYSAAAERGITVVSIVHQAALNAFHSRALDVKGGGPWTVQPLP